MTIGLGGWDGEGGSEDPREVIRALREAAKPAHPDRVDENDPSGMRRVGVAPPPRIARARVVDRPARPEPGPTPVRSAPTAGDAPGDLLDDTPYALREVVVAREAPTAPLAASRTSGRYGGRTAADGGVGWRVGGRRAIGLYLERELREALEERRRATGLTRGALLIDALEAASDALIEEGLAKTGREAGRFGPPPRSPRRVADGGTVTFYVTDAQAYALGALARDLDRSVSETGAAALRRWLGIDAPH